MFREMRRKNQALSTEACGHILNMGSSGVLALSGDGGYPYAVPLSYVWDGESIYFHSAANGHKLDAIAGSPKASFCVVDKDQVVPEKYTTYFKSVIVFGQITVLEDREETVSALQKLAQKYSHGMPLSATHAEITQSLPRLKVFRLIPEHITGKEAMELSAAKI